MNLGLVFQEVLLENKCPGNWLSCQDWVPSQDPYRRIILFLHTQIHSYKYIDDWWYIDTNR